MVDTFTEEQRSKNMKAIKSKRTSLEERVSKALWNKGIRFRKNVNDLFGRPDIAIKKYKIAIFIDSCFWHACPDHGRLPDANREYWAKKLARNKQRDTEVTETYLARKWNIIRIWEHEVRNDFNAAIDRIVEVIQLAKGQR